MLQTHTLVRSRTADIRYTQLSSSRPLVSHLHYKKAMPRRRAPTALRLHKGPLPSRVDPRHIMPQPPCPSLAPTGPIPTTKSITVDLPAPLPAIMTVQFQVAATHSSASSKAAVVGPWDSTPIRHFSTSIGKGFGSDAPLIAPPKPVVTAKPSSPKRGW